MEKWLTYDQITLIPTKISTLKSRAEAETVTQFGPARLNVPIIAAPMPDISSSKMVAALVEAGSFGWIHRFQTIDSQAKDIASLVHDYGVGLPGFGVGVSVHNALAEVEMLHTGYGVQIFCIDTANGASTLVEKAIKSIKEKYSVFIVAGNVASKEAFYQLESWGADAIRVGIGGGSVCETRTETGIYSPMASVILDVKQREVEANRIRADMLVMQLKWGTPDWTLLRPRHQALLIADGGIKSPADVCKALALGADLVMMGGAFAGTDETPGELITTEHGLQKQFSGAASYTVQKKSGRDKIVHVEGKTTLVPAIGPVKGVIERYAAGLRSSMSYMDARNLTEYRANAKIVELS